MNLTKCSVFFKPSFSSKDIASATDLLRTYTCIEKEIKRERGREGGEK